MEGFNFILYSDITRTALDQRPFQMWPDLADQLTELYNPVEKARQKSQELVANLHIEDLGSVRSKIDKLKAAIDKANSDIAKYNKELSNKKYLKSTKNSIRAKVDNAKKLINTNQSEIDRLTDDANTRIDTFNNVIKEYGAQVDELYKNVKILADKNGKKTG